MTKPKFEDAARSELRRRAEKSVARRNTKLAAGATDDPRRLLHELEVHQIELELQNEELRIARNKAETALLRYTEIFDFGPIGYVVLGEDGSIGQINFAAARLLGGLRKHLVGKRFGVFVAEPHRQRFHHFLGQVATRERHGAKPSCEVSLHASGVPREVRLTGRLIERAPPVTLVSVEDVTARKRAEAVLERLFPGHSEMASRMRAFDWAKTPMGDPLTWPENLRIAVAVCLTSRFPMHVWWGPALTLLYNDAYISFLGPAKHPWALGRSGREVWSEIWERIGPRIERVLAAGGASWSEEALVHFEGAGAPEGVRVAFSFSPIVGDTGTVDGMFCSVTETSGTLVGARRIETFRKLGIEAAVVRNVRDACSAAAAGLGESTKHEPFAAIYLGSGADDVRLAASVGLEGHRAKLPASAPLATGPPSVGGAVVVPIHAGTDDALVGHLVAGLNPEGPVEKAYLSFFYLAASHLGAAVAEARAHEQQQQRAEELAALDRAKTAFFSNVSHELRTPLTLLLGPLEEELRANPDPPERLRIAQRNAVRLLKLVNNLLDFSRIEAERIEAVYEATDLAAYTAELTSVFRSATESAGLALVIDCAVVPEPVYVDREMWEKIVLNLLSNALKFTFQGSIEARLRSHGGRVELTVKDSGVGIPEAELPSIFDRFHRVRGARSRTHEGTGIGLSLVREFVRLHGGEVRVESAVGRGTTFTVSIPTGRAHLREEAIGPARELAAPAAVAEAFALEAKQWASVEEPPAPLEDESRRARARSRVLLVDDNSDMRAYLAGLLASDDHLVTVAANGAQALAAARANPPDLVLADVMMPVLDGFGLLRELRADPRLRELPVILLSARAGEESSVEGLDRGADDYLVKPFTARELLARVRTHLTLAEMRAAAVRDREAAQASRIDLLRRLETAQEDERQRVARDLHDQIGQELTAVALLVRLARAAGHVSPLLTSRLAEVQAMTDKVSRDVHALAVRLRPTALDDLGLSAAVAQLVADWSARTEVAVDLQDDTRAAQRLPGAVETALYRVVQEALTNIARHASARHASVALARHDGRAIVMIEDDGCGFEPANVARGRIGVLGMRERVAQLGGTLDIESELGKGTTVIARIPSSERDGEPTPA